MVDLLRVESNERVDLGDFQYLANEVLVNAIRDQGRGFLTNPNGTVKTWILSGFGMTNPAGKQLTVTRGRALLGYRVGGLTNYGMLTIDGDASKTIDMTALTPATYNVYVRFEYIDTTSASRVFWDPAGTGQEFVQTVPTRLQANWSLRVETSSPGTEWTLIGTADNSGGSLALVDMRPFYFEGDPNATPPYRSGWSTDGGGGADDRDSDRGIYGVQDLQTFTAAMRQCLEDIKGRGLRRWWQRDIGGMNIGFDDVPVEDRLAIGDVNFSFDFFSGNPKCLFDSLDYVQFNRTSSYWGWYTGNVERARLSPTGLALEKGLAVGYLTSSAPEDAVAVGDANFSMQWSSNPQIYWDANDYVVYNRTGNYWQWVINSSVEAQLSASGLAVQNGLYVGSSGVTPTDNEIIAEGYMRCGGRLYLSADDFFDLASATSIDTIIDGNTEMRVSADGVAINNGLYVGNYAGTPGDNDIQAEGAITANTNITSTTGNIVATAGEVQGIRGQFNDTSKTVPSTATDLVERHGQNAVLAVIQFTVTGPGTSPTITLGTAHFNVNTVTRIGVGSYSVDFDVDVSADACVLATTNGPFNQCGGVITGGGTGATISLGDGSGSGGFDPSGTAIFNVIVVGRPSGTP